MTAEELHELAEDLLLPSGTFPIPTPEVFMLDAGEHLLFWCGKLYHHGIYIGNNEVIHMEPTKNISKSSVSEFIRGRHKDMGDWILAVKYRDDTPEKKANVANVAQRLYDEGLHAYDIPQERVCDGFVYYCRYGKWISQQLHTALKTVVFVKAIDDCKLTILNSS